MRILFDQGTPVPLRQFLSSHDVETVFERRWHKLQNGELLGVADGDGFNVFVTTDQSIHYQQNLTGRRIAIVVLGTTDWGIIQQHTDRITAAVSNLSPGDYVEIIFPARR